MEVAECISYLNPPPPFDSCSQREIDELANVVPSLYFSGKGKLMSST